MGQFVRDTKPIPVGLPLVRVLINEDLGQRRSHKGLNAIVLVIRKDLGQPGRRDNIDMQFDVNDLFYGDRDFP